MINEEQKNLLSTKFKQSKNSYAFYASDFDKESVSRTLTQLETSLTENPNAIIIVIPTN